MLRKKKKERDQQVQKLKCLSKDLINKNLILKFLINKVNYLIHHLRWLSNLRRKKQKSKIETLEFSLKLKSQKANTVISSNIIIKG